LPVEVRQSAPLGADMDERAYMREALREALRAYRLGEVPVGALVVHEGRIVGRGHNCKETLADPTAHAEILALREAARVLGRWRLGDCTVYSTLEPCPMCAGALIQARVDALVYAADDPKAGACGSVVDLLSCDGFNHRVVVRKGLMAESSRRLLRRFFRQLRRRGVVA